MQNRYYILAGIVTLMVVICSSGCISNEQKGPGGTVTVTPQTGKIVEGNGTIWYIALSGGFYGILGDDGNEYAPVSLAEEYRADGQRVAFRAVTTGKTSSSPDWGIPVEISSIRKLPEGIVNMSDEDFYRKFKDIPPSYITIAGGGENPAMIGTREIPPPLTSPSR